MNVANERDPHNNNSYGTLVDRDYVRVELPILDVDDFNNRIICGYEQGYGEKLLPADLTTARSLIPAGTATLRDFSYVAPEIPEYITENCTGCMDCVTECPDTAILGKVLSESQLEEKLKETPRRRPRDVPRPMVQDQKVLRRPQEEGQRGRDVQHHDRPLEVQRLRGMRDRLRRPRPQNDSQIRRDDGEHPQEPSLLQTDRPLQRGLHQRQPADRHDAQRANPHLRRRGGFVRGLRRRHGPADDVLGDGGQVRRPVGHRRRHRLQHGLHFDLSLQSLPRALDQFAL